MDALVRERLGQLWLPWFYAKDDRARVIDLSLDAPETARPLRVSDVERAGVQRVLESEARADGTTKWERIQGQVERLAAYEFVLLILCAWDNGRGPMLIDCCHRTCALYLLDPPRVEYELIFTRLPDDDPQARVMAALDD